MPTEVVCQKASLHPGVRIYFSATSQTWNRLVNNLWGFVAAIENIVIGVRVTVYYSAATHTVPSFRGLGVENNTSELLLALRI
jgi:hypothetical protein